MIVEGKVKDYLVKFDEPTAIRDVYKKGCFSKNLNVFDSHYNAYGGMAKPTLFAGDKKPIFLILRINFKSKAGFAHGLYSTLPLIQLEYARYPNVAFNHFLESVEHSVTTHFDSNSFPTRETYKETWQVHVM